MSVKRRIITYKQRFLDFYKEQDSKIQRKIEYVLDLVRFEERIPIRFFKFLEGSNGIYEIRVLTTFKNIRILCFFDKGELIVLTILLTKENTKDPQKRD